MLKYLKYLLLFYIVGANYITSAANILAITTLCSPSHHHFNDVYLFELVKRGHNVTVLVHDQDRHNHPNYTHIIIEDVYENIIKTVNFMEWARMSTWRLLNSFHSYMELTCELDLKSEGLKTLLRYPKDYKFDLVIWDIGSGQCHLPLIERFGNPPIIGINPFVNQPNTFKNVWQSHVPFMSHSLTAHMTTWQRAYTSFFKFCFDFMKYFYYDPRQRKMGEEFYGNFDSSVEEIERKMSMVLTNYNPLCNTIEALPPNLIPIGGLHIQMKPLPKDIKDILDKSVNGVILFSLGTNVDPNQLGPEMIKSILRAFEKLPYTVFWKNKDVSQINVPKNVHVRKWLPQNEILAHKNTILFISHCGLLSTQEIVYHGVPVVGIPFIIDQYQNIKSLEERGIGRPLYLNELSEETFSNAIQIVVNNKSFKEKAKKASLLTKFFVGNPLETAIKWTEFLLEHKSLKELDMVTRDMNVFQLINFDLYLIFFSLLAVSIVFVCAIVKCCTRFLKTDSRRKVKTN